MSEYQTLISEYQRLISEYQRLMSKYQRLMSEYQTLVGEYQRLIHYGWAHAGKMRAHVGAPLRFNDSYFPK